MFNWRLFLDRHHLDYTLDRGERNATLQCPWCGAADAKKHDLSISINGRGYKCWRNRAHRGRSNARLVQAMLRCSWDQARELTGEQTLAPLQDDVSFAATVAANLGVKTGVSHERLSLPDESKPLLSYSGLAKPFWYYMRRRGFSDEEIVWLAASYGLRYSTVGPTRYRIVIPVNDDRGRLMTYTARTITDDPLRYKTLRSDVSVRPPSQLLLGLDLLWKVRNPNVLVICEGPLDAMRVSATGHYEGIYGTCLFGLQASGAQAELLEELSTRFPRMRLLLDDDASLRAFAVLHTFAVLPIKSARLPSGIKDPGALTGALAREVILGLVN